MFTLEDYKQLSNSSSSDKPFISLYINTDRVGDDDKYRIKFKNALKYALNQLEDEAFMGEQAMNRNQAQQYLSEAYDLLENTKFWSHLSDGLAVFISENEFHKFLVPVHFDDFTYVGDSFYLRHMMTALNDDHRFFVLALSQNDVRFFEGGEHSITPVKIEDLVPTSIGELIGADDNEKAFQHHNNGNHTTYHGQGGAKDGEDDDLQKYLRNIDDGLMKMLHDERVPMIVYGTEEIASKFQNTSKYSNIFEGYVAGNPDEDDPVMIHEKAWSQLRGHFSQARQALHDQFEQALVAEQASFSIHDVVPAAINGKIDTLFVDRSTKELWGSFDVETNAITIHNERQADSECLLSKAATATMNNGGRVLNIPRMEFPRIVAQANAIYRY